MKVIKWGTTLLLSVFFILMGIQKFGSENVIFATIALKSGMALFEPYVRMLVGIAELIAAALLVPPATRFLGALLGIGLLFGAVGFHLSPWLGISVSVEPGGEPSSMLFMTAVFFTGVNLVVLALEKNSIANALRFLRPSQARTGMSQT